MRTILDILSGKRKSLISDINSGVIAELMCKKAWDFINFTVSNFGSNLLF